jgi:hypothetical protein
MRAALPEETAYADGGCDLHPACLTCPFPACRYDLPGGAPELLAMVRAGRVRAAAARGLAPAEIARELGLNVRMVFRDLAGAR